MFHPIAELLDVARHDRSTFESSVPEVDKIFRHAANKLTPTANVRKFVLDW